MDEFEKQRVVSNNHHKHVLSEMFKFVQAEALTDVTFVCSQSKPVYAHRKVLEQMSTLVRKIANTRPRDERLVIVLDVRSQNYLSRPQIT